MRNEMNCCKAVRHLCICFVRVACVRITQTPCTFLYSFFLEKNSMVYHVALFVGGYVHHALIGYSVAVTHPWLQVKWVPANNKYGKRPTKQILTAREKTAFEKKYVEVREMEIMKFRVKKKEKKRKDIKHLHLHFLASSFFLFFFFWKRVGSRNIIISISGASSFFQSKFFPICFIGPAVTFYSSSLSLLSIARSSTARTRASGETGQPWRIPASTAKYSDSHPQYATQLLMSAIRTGHALQNRVRF